MCLQDSGHNQEIMFLLLDTTTGSPKAESKIARLNAMTKYANAQVIYPQDRRR
ncbi:hypothetical protein Plhal304r1_c035g0109241 [Plasmopara halstedii]